MHGREKQSRKRLNITKQSKQLQLPHQNIEPWPSLILLKRGQRRLRNHEAYHYEHSNLLHKLLQNQLLSKQGVINPRRWVPTQGEINPEVTGVSATTKIITTLMISATMKIIEILHNELLSEQGEFKQESTEENTMEYGVQKSQLGRQDHRAVHLHRH